MVAGIAVGSAIILFLISLFLLRRRLQSLTAKSSRIDIKGNEHFYLKVEHINFL